MLVVVELAIRDVAQGSAGSRSVSDGGGRVKDSMILEGRCSSLEGI